MFTTKLVFIFGSAFGIAAAQVAGDAPGVTVDVGGAALLHRAPVRYPVGTAGNGVKGSVIVEVSLDAKGNVSDAHVVSGPDELRRGALESVLQWHFAHETAGARRQVTISFNSPPAGSALAPEGPSRQFGVITPGPSDGRVIEERLRTLQLQAEAARKLPPPNTVRTIESIQTPGLSDPLRSELLSKLPVHAGDTLSPELMERASRAVREFDEHMSIMMSSVSPSGATLQIGAPESRMLPRVETTMAMAAPAPMTATGPTTTPERIRVGGNVQQSKLVSQPRPAYPVEAKAARIQGRVSLSTIIAKDGTVAQIEVMSGHPLLVPAALEAVKQWVYQPTLLNGSPVEVATQIDVNFTLSQ